MVTSGISMDKSAQKESLEWIRKESLDPNCVRSLACHGIEEKTEVFKFYKCLTFLWHFNTYPHQSFILLIDEIHRMTKNIQDYLLPYLESEQVMLIGVTTENPIMSIVPAVRSRCQIFEFKALSDQNILTVLKNGDLPSVVRRLREIPYTYIGLANPEQVTQIVVAANQAEKIGMPKATYPLMFATMLMCLSPKSGSFDQVWEQLDQDTQYPGQHPMPRGLRDMHYKHSEEITGGVLIENPFEQPFQIAKQNYMPKGFEGKRYYFAKDNLNEKKLEQQYLKLHKYIYGQDYKK